MSPLIKHLLTINKKSDILDYKRQLKLKKSDFFDFLKNHDFYQPWNLSL